MIALVRHASPLGELTLALRGGRICGLAWTDHFARVDRALTRRFRDAERTSGRAPTEVLHRLDAFFDGELAALDGIPLDLRGTSFQRAVWEALCKVPAGRTTTYAELARAAGAPTAVRAVGAANGANPVSLVVPCHRAIGTDGSLTGYAGGLDRKRWLLAHEGARFR
jgi:methylated-DNA-[protein]-cysteine S-methyltransferase